MSNPSTGRPDATQDKDGTLGSSSSDSQPTNIDAEKTPSTQASPVENSALFGSLGNFTTIIEEEQNPQGKSKNTQSSSSADQSGSNDDEAIEIDDSQSSGNGKGLLENASGFANVDVNVNDRTVEDSEGNFNEEIQDIVGQIMSEVINKLETKEIIQDTSGPSNNTDEQQQPQPQPESSQPQPEPSQPKPLGNADQTEGNDNNTVDENEPIIDKEVLNLMGMGFVSKEQNNALSQSQKQTSSSFEENIEGIEQDGDNNSPPPPPPQQQQQSGDSKKPLLDVIFENQDNLNKVLEPMFKGDKDGFNQALNDMAKQSQTGSEENENDLNETTALSDDDLNPYIDAYEHFQEALAEADKAYAAQADGYKNIEQKMNKDAYSRKYATKTDKFTQLAASVIFLAGISSGGALAINHITRIPVVQNFMNRTPVSDLSQMFGWTKQLVTQIENISNAISKGLINSNKIPTKVKDLIQWFSGLGLADKMRNKIDIVANHKLLSKVLPSLVVLGVFCLASVMIATGIYKLASAVFGFKAARREKFLKDENYDYGVTLNNNEVKAPLDSPEEFAEVNEKTGALTLKADYKNSTNRNAAEETFLAKFVESAKSNKFLSKLMKEKEATASQDQSSTVQQNTLDKDLKINPEFKRNLDKFLDKLGVAQNQSVSK